MTIPTGFVKSTIHASGRASSRTRSAIPRTTGTVRIAFAKPPAPVVSWPMHPQASGAVSSSSLAACPPTRSWSRTNDGPLDRSVEVVRDGERAAEALPLEHPRCHLTDDPAPLGVDVVEDELLDGDPGSLERQPGDELGRVGRPTTDHGELHPFTPVSVTPSTNAFCARKKTTTTGSMISSVAAIVRFHCTWCRLRNWASPIEATQWSGFSPT